MEFFLRGGPIMWPILLESIIALWVIIERCAFFLTVLPDRKKGLRALSGGPHDASPGGNPTGSKDIAGIADVLGRARSDGKTDQQLLAVHFDRLVRESEHNLSILSIVVQSAPMLGLLGTVTGMIRAFIVIEKLGGSVNPSDLAQGIWEALITTAGGLAVAIPALMAYWVFDRIVDRYAAEIESAISRALGGVPARPGEAV